MTVIDYVDICVGLAWGDEAKGKIVLDLVREGNYDWVCRWNGGSNAGHTIYINKNKYNTNIVPCGIFNDINCFIGPDCYINIDDLEKEMIYLKENGCNLDFLKISPLAHVITNSHKEEDLKKYKIQQGSTGKGIAPCARDKFGRTGLRFKDCLDYDFKIFNPEKNLLKGELYGKILCEGAQGFWLDVNYGNYPYVTSSYTLPYSACSLGFPPQKIRHIYGAAKIYDTRVGIDPEFSETIIDKSSLEEIVNVGSEFGTTTGRMRAANWLNLDKLIHSIVQSGVTHVIISKVDILEKVGKFKFIHLNKLNKCNTIDIMKAYIEMAIKTNSEFVKEITWSNNPYSIKN